MIALIMNFVGFLLLDFLLLDFQNITNLNFDINIF